MKLVELWAIFSLVFMPQLDCFITISCEITHYLECFQTGIERIGIGTLKNQLQHLESVNSTEVSTANGLKYFPQVRVPKNREHAHCVSLNFYWSFTAYHCKFSSMLVSAQSFTRFEYTVLIRLVRNYLRANIFPLLKRPI